MTTIGLFDSLPLRLESYEKLIKSFEGTSVLFKASSLSQLLSKLNYSKPSVLIILSSKADENFKNVALSISKFRLRTIAITPQASKWLIPNMKSLNIMGYVAMSTGRTTLIDAILSVSGGNLYCCNEVSSILLGMSNNIPAEEFSPREKEIIKLLIDDKSSKEIAATLCLSQHTISSHRKAILRKFQVNSTTGMVKKAIDAGLA